MMIWEDCVKRDARKARAQEDGKKNRNYLLWLKILSDEWRRSCGQHITPDTGKKRKIYICHVVKPYHYRPC